MNPISSRRDLLAAALSLPLLSKSLPAATASRSGAGKRLLVLGGTRFLGPAIVDAALERGFEVTLFNRGVSNPHLYPDLEKLVGDRDKSELSALEGREWDYVVDTSAYLPTHAAETGELLADHVGHYVMISTLSVYDAADQSPVKDESAPVGEVTVEQAEQVTAIRDVYRVAGGAYYGPLKALCEDELERLMPGRFTSLRPGVIAGREDPSDRLPYWVIRVEQGGEILCPGDPDLGIHFTDVRDLGRFSLDFAQQGLAGIYNANGFEGKITLQELVHGCKAVMGSNCSFTWIDEAWLLEQQVRPFSEMPFWLPKGYSTTFDNQKGIEAGMKFRPIAETIRETADWFHEVRDESYRWRAYGMQPEREQELLAAWHSARSAASEGQEGE